MKANTLNISIIVVYTPTAKSTEEKIEKVCCTQDNAWVQCKLQDIEIAMEVLNAKISREIVKYLENSDYEVVMNAGENEYNGLWVMIR